MNGGDVAGVVAGDSPRDLRPEDRSEPGGRDDATSEDDAGVGSRYDAFISYRHGADDDVAAAIERGLERLARPWNRLRAMSVFRDLSDLAAESDLTGAITRGLDASRFLVLVASPESAASPWVDKEVAYWCDRSRGVKQLIVVVTDGEFEWNESTGALTPSTDAVSPAVRSRFTTEPLYVDLRWARTATELSLRDSRFRSAVVRIGATIRGIAPADLESEDVRLHRRARRLARVAVATMLVLALVASVAAVAAVANAREAERRARDALGRQLGLTALDLPAGEADQAFLLSLVAADLDSSDDARDFQASRTLIGRYFRLAKLLYATGTTSLQNVAISLDGVVAATTQRDGNAVLLTWPAGSRDPTETRLPGALGDTPPISFLDGGRLLVGDTSSGIVTLDADGDIVASFPDPLAVDLDERIVAERYPGGLIMLTDLASKALLASADADEGRADLRYRRLATASEDEIVVVDADNATEGRGRLPSGRDVTAIAAGPTDEVAAVTASPEGIVPWAWSGDGLLAGDAVALPGGVGPPAEVVVAPDGARVLVVGATGSAIINLGTGAADAVDRGEMGRIVVDPSGRFAAAVGGGRLMVWDLVSGVTTFAVPLPVIAMAWSGACETGCRLVTAGQSLDAWDPFTRRRVQLVDQTNAQAVATSADGNTVVSTGWGSTVAVWQLRPNVDNSGRSEVVASDVLAGGASQCAAADGDLRAVSPDGTLVVTHRPSDGNTTVCRTSDGAPVATGDIRPFESPPDAVAVDESGSIAIAGGGGVVVRYTRQDARFTHGQVVRLGSEPMDVTALAYRAGTIVGGLRPRDDEAAPARVLVWAEAGGGAVTFESDYLDVPAVALLGDEAGLVLVAGRDSSDGPVTLQVWDTLTRVRLGRALDGLTGDVVALGGDEAAVFAVDGSGTAYRWVLDRDPTRDICDIVGRPLRPDEWDTLADGALRPFRHKEMCPAATAPPRQPLGSTAG